MLTRAVRMSVVSEESGRAVFSSVSGGAGRSVGWRMGRREEDRPSVWTLWTCLSKRSAGFGRLGCARPFEIRPNIAGTCRSARQPSRKRTCYTTPMFRWQCPSIPAAVPPQVPSDSAVAHWQRMDSASCSSRRVSFDRWRLVCHTHSPGAGVQPPFGDGAPRGLAPLSATGQAP